MKLYRHIIGTALATALVATSAVAQPAATKLSLSKSAKAGELRAGTAKGKSNRAVGGFLIPAIAIIAIIGGVLIVSDDSDSP